MNRRTRRGVLAVVDWIDDLAREEENRECYVSERNWPRWDTPEGRRWYARGAALAAEQEAARAALWRLLGGQGAPPPRGSR